MDHYPSEKFSQAVDSLATGLGSLQERIASAFAYGLSHLLPRHEDLLPPEVANRLREYEEEWSALGDVGGKGQIAVWVSGLSDDEAIEVATWINATASRLNMEYWIAAGRSRATSTAP